MRAATGRRSARGFVLVVVLWTIALVAAIGVAMGSRARTEARIARNLIDAATAEAAVDGAVAEAAFRMQIEGPGRWRAGGGERVLSVGGTRVAVRIEDERGKVNPNLAPAALLAALVEAVGGERATALALAREIVDWRGGPGADPAAAAARYAEAGRAYVPPGRPFRDIDEIGLVLGMEPEMRARILPLFSLVRAGSPDPALAPVAVRRALASAPWNAPPASAENGAAFTFVARTDGPAAVTRRVVLRLGCEDGSAGCAVPLAWSRGGD